MNAIDNSVSQTAEKKKSAFSTQDMVMIGMFAALLAVISQISLPMPSGVPITIQIFGVVLVGVVLGSKKGFFATLVYILLGAVGLPIFANFRGGIQVLVGTSGGYILSWPVVTLLSGIRPKVQSQAGRLAAVLVAAVIGVLICEFVGGFQWYWLVRGSESAQAYTAIMAYSFVAFIPKDMVLTVLAVILGQQIRKPLVRGGLLAE